jgi:hypothetical protein
VPGRAMCRGDPVARLQCLARSDGYRFLSLVLVKSARKLSLKKELINAIFESSNSKHLFVVVQGHVWSELREINRFDHE